jgi:hypothetical protein
LRAHAYDLKPDAPVEFRGEFKPIQTNVPGMDICELMPLQAKIADQMTIVRNMKYRHDFHAPLNLLTGAVTPDKQPDIGATVQRLRRTGGI